MLLSLPIIAAVLWGVFYALVETSLKDISVATYMLLTGISAILASLIYHYFSDDKISVSALFDGKIFLICIASLIVARFADFAILESVRLFGSTYTSFGEVAYPIFVPFFVWLLNGQNNITTSTVIGGVLIMSGVYLMMFGELSKDKDAEDSLITAKVEIEDVIDTAAITVSSYQEKDIR